MLIIHVLIGFSTICWFSIYTENAYALDFPKSESIQENLAGNKSFEKELYSSESIDYLKILNCHNLSQTLNLSNSSLVSTPRLSVSNNNVFVVWEEGKGGTSNIVYRHSNDSGITFGPATSISSNEKEIKKNSHDDNIKVEDISSSYDSASQPDITSTAENVYIVWKSLQSGIQLKHSNDSGITFGPPTTLTNDTSVSDLKLAASGDNVYIVWKDIVSGNPTIFYKKSMGNAQDFGPVLKLTEINHTGYGPDIQVAGQNESVFTVWNSADNGIGFAFSNNGGSTFENIGNMSAPSVSISDLKLAASGDNVYIVWKQEGDFVFIKFYKSSPYYGKPISFNDLVGNRLNLWGSNSINVGAYNEILYSVWIQPHYVKSEADISYNEIFYAKLNTNFMTSDCYQ